MNRKIVCNNYEKSKADSKSCQLLSIALSEIIKHSVRDEFRDCCLNLLKTDSSLDAQVKLAQNLSSILSHDKYVVQVKKDDTM